MPKTMKAVVMYEPGNAEVLKLGIRPVPVPQPGQVLIRIKAFGLNRSEFFTRSGNSMNHATFPRILGIEGTGIVEDAPGGEFNKGDIVATSLGGMGIAFDGSYAEYTCVLATQVQAIKTKLEWETLGAIPEMLQTAWGALFRSLKLKKGDHLLIRGGTSSVGLAAAAIAKNHGAFVASTTRRADRKNMLVANGADEVFIDDGHIAEKVKKGEKFDKIFELVGTTTLEDSLQCARENGIVCMAGIVGNSWTLPNFHPIRAIPKSVYFATYAGDAGDFMATPLEELCQQVAAGKLHVQMGKTFKIDEIVEAHKCMEQNEAGGKIVVLV
ncbi:Quinone oxidoreductase [Lachnellula willkommii]|uniref:Quinone oxidoreductase n=1 Tax=Lachnellula willkommii TaxID=215461 RepID=A0A559MIM0_9HELO|nr:Quinone oxidoreductase [Lachnellula willkommii]